ncbi:MAG: H-NS family nucleoid-associated regulatory protein [Hyphomicrobium sp.]
MARINPTTMSYRDLLALKQRLDRAISVKRATQAQEVKAKLEALAQESGFSLGELLDGQRPKRKRKAAVQYRNPKNPSQTWSGLGRRPQWLLEAIKGGVKLEKLAI